MKELFWENAARKVNIGETFTAKVDAWQCVKCNYLFQGGGAEYAARACCSPIVECSICGYQHEKRTCCPFCAERRSRIACLAYFDKSEWVDVCDIEGPYMLHDDIDYFEDMTDYLEQEFDLDEPAKYLYVAEFFPAKVDPYNIIEHVVDGMYEDAEMPTEAEEKLLQVCAEVNAIMEKKEFGHFEMTHKRKVKVPDE